jgi:hypothetical protein
MYQKDKVHITILLEGSKENIRMAVEDLHRHFLSASQETVEETARHRNWLQNEIGALHSRVRNRHTTISFRLVTPGPVSLFSGPEVLRDVKEFTDLWRDRVSIVDFHIDTRTVPEATASVIWTAGGKDQCIIGSLGNNHGAYFRIMRHFFYQDDTTAFFQALATHQVAPIPYRHKQQWSTTYSPLRLEFRNEDPHRNGLGLGSAPDASLIVGGFLPADDVAITVGTTWIDGLTILLHGDLHGILPGFDDDGQLVVSGYALYAAGVIGADLRPTNGLTDAERRRFRLDNSAPENAAMHAMVFMYHDWLVATLDQDLYGDPESKIARRLRDHLDSATRWLVENGVMQPPHQAGRPHEEVIRRDRKKQPS